MSSGNCSNPLGMQSGSIPNSSITASSSVGPGHEPWRGRLHYKGLPHISQSTINSGVWAAGMPNQTAGQYLQVKYYNQIA